MRLAALRRGLHVLAALLSISTCLVGTATAADGAVAQPPAPAASAPQAMCTPASNAEMIIRINMATLGDPRFVPVDERTGTLEWGRNAESGALVFKSSTTQPAGEWYFFFHPCGDIDEAVALYDYDRVACPGRVPRNVPQLRTLIDAHFHRSGKKPLDWDTYEVRLRHNSCTDTLHLVPKRPVHHGDFFVDVTADGLPVVGNRVLGTSPSANGQIPQVRP